MAAAYVKEIGKNNLDSASSTLVVTLSATPASTSLIVARVCVDSARTVSSIADSRSNTWTVDKQQTNGPKSAICSTGQNTARLQSGDTVTFTFSGSGNARIAIIDEFSGCDVSGSRVDSSQAATASGTSRSAGTITTGVANALIVCCYGSGIGENAWAKGTGFSDFTTTFLNSPGADNMLVEGQYQVATTATGYTTPATGISQSSNGCAVSYKPSAGSPPVNTVAPVVSGTTTVGQALSCTTGTWTTSNPVYTYQWQRDAFGNSIYSDIGSATSSSYTLVDADDGCNIRCNVKDTDDNGNTTQASNSVGLITEAAVPGNTVAPAVTGSTTIGSTLTTDHGTWTGMGGHTATYTQKWQRDVQGSGSYSDIAGQTGTTYVLAAADDACHVRSVVTATNDVGAGTPTNSNAILDTTPVPASDTAQNSGSAAPFVLFISGAY